MFNVMFYELLSSGKVSLLWKYCQEEIKNEKSSCPTLLVTCLMYADAEFYGFSCHLLRRLA